MSKEFQKGKYLFTEIPDQEERLIEDKYYDVFIYGEWQGSRRLTSTEIEEFNEKMRDL